MLSKRKLLEKTRKEVWPTGFLEETPEQRETKIITIGKLLDRYNA